ncbi:MAG TPA: hypothetical protein V6D26_03435 [Stenomitos sp.]
MTHLRKHIPIPYTPHPTPYTPYGNLAAHQLSCDRLTRKSHLADCPHPNRPHPWESG